MCSPKADKISRKRRRARVILAIIIKFHLGDNLGETTTVVSLTNIIVFSGIHWISTFLWVISRSSILSYGGPYSPNKPFHLLVVSRNNLIRSGVSLVCRSSHHMGIKISIDCPRRAEAETQEVQVQFAVAAGRAAALESLRVSRTFSNWIALVCKAVPR